ncbi:hypothetical protein GCM10009844_38660 [Nocardioides koreensis]|uniref:Acyl-CoA dehydrogenase n=1 Tax=Nocardioides koreensis TaxID=433651 RepID=A0ABP5LYW3_9ACTN
MGQDGWTTSVSEATEAVRAVVSEVLDRATGDLDADWSALAAAGLLGLPVPEEHGGEGLGLVEVAVLLREAGARGARLPVWETLCCSALTLAAHGTDAQRAELLPGVADGGRLLSPAVREAGRGIPEGPSTTVAGEGAGVRVTGRKVGVTYADRASRLLVPATRAGTAAVVVLVDPVGPGVTLLPSGSSSGEPTHTVVLDGAPADLLDPGNADGRAARLLCELAVAGLCVSAAGVVAGARDLTASYVTGREQFGRRLAEFQAVAQQVADVHIASRTLDLAATNAAWRVAEGLDATDDLAVAAYWTTTQGPAALRTCHHLHGGMGVDETYPLHRFFSRVTDIAHALDASAADVRLEDPAAKNLELTADQRTLKAELRGYFTGLAGREEHAEMGRDRHGETYQRVVRQMGKDGWMGVGWPTEYGGHGLGEVEQTIFANEAQRADVHLPAVTLQTVGPTLIRYGTQKQKDLFLQRILEGDVHFAIGYSEPDAGTDLASLRTSARLVDEGDGAPCYVVNGQKLWTTGGHQADYLWLAVRTDPDAPKHRGISILIVDTSDPGYSWTPIITADGSHHVNATYFNDVRVPADMLVGEENEGWRLITTQLNHERVMLGPAGRLEGLRDRVAEWAAGAGVLDAPDVRATMGRVTAAFRVNELLNWEVARAAEQSISVADASSSKVFASEQVQHLLADLAAVVHRYGDPSEGETAHLMAYLDAQAKRNLVLTFGGGVNEVQRELIAMFGLGLPRVPR